MTAPRKTAAKKATTAARSQTAQAGAPPSVFVKPELTFEEKLDLQSLPEADVPIYLDARGVGEVERLEARLAELTGGEKQSRMGGDPEARRIAQEIVDRQAAMAASLQLFVLRALPRRKYNELKLQHLPRPGNAADAALGFNTSTFIEPLVRACIVSPEMDDEQFERVTDRMSQAQWSKLYNTAYGLNERDVSVPFSQRASLTLGITAKS